MSNVLRPCPVVEDRLVRLPDGRQLGVAEYGDPAGTPIAYCHGFGGSRLQVHPDPTIAAARGVRLVAPDRPGVGVSSPQRGRTLLDWPRDVAALADALGLDRFAVLGSSGGGAYALACAAALPQRVTAVGLVSSAAPLAGTAARPYLTSDWQRAMGRGAPWLMRRFFAQLARQCRNDPAGVLARSIAAMTPQGQAVAANRAVCERLLAAVIAGYAQGGCGAAADAVILARDWGFDLATIQQPVHLWHGEADPVWHPTAGR